MLSPKLKNFLTYKWSLSRVGFVLVAIWVFLTIISFVKGIQILMFIPALVAALFIHSYLEIRSISKKIRVIGTREGIGYSIGIYGKGIHQFYFRMGIRHLGKITMIQPKINSIDFCIPADSQGELIILFTGSFDILRHQIILFPIQEDRQDQKKAPPDADEQKLSYIHVHKYESGDQTHRMDSKRSSIRNHPYIKTLESFVIWNNSHGNPLENLLPIRIQSALSLVRKNDLARADTIHIFFILLNFTVIFVQWRNYILSGILLLTILVVFTLRKTVTFPPKRIFWYKNGTILFFFCLMLWFTYFQGNMGLPGSVFLTQILVIKKLFPDQKEDGFLYIFLSLFVFVAIAITSTALWFILFFLGYLMLAILLLSTVSGYGFSEPVNAAIGTRISGKSYFTILVSILFMMGVLFFILPHGEAREATNSTSPSLGNQTISGFSSEINLKNVANIKKDVSKKIVISDVTEEQSEAFKSSYWRGNRFTVFRDNKWENSGYETRNTIRVGTGGVMRTNTGVWNASTLTYPLPSLDTIEKWRITYYTLGIPQLFFPKIPEGFRLQGEALYTSVELSKNDHSLYQISQPSQNPVSLDIYLRHSKNREQSIDVPVAFTPFRSHITPETEKLFQKFWDSLDPNLQKNPTQLASYIRNRAGFEYSIDAPAESLASFLYDEKQGHCEYFATVLALTLQHYGYQATIVNGFQGGVWNQLMGAFVVQWQDAHAWVEIYDTQKQAWTVLDATPNQLTLTQKLSLQNLKTEFFKVYDYLDIKWYTYIANYSSTSQRVLLLKIWAYRYYILLLLLTFPLWHGISFGYRTVQKMTSEDYETKLLRYLWGASWVKFICKKYMQNNPDLVQKTRALLYGKHPLKKEAYRELKAAWKAIL